MSIYLDYNATTPVAPDVLEAMLPYFSERFGNPSSSTHTRGWEAAAAVDRAREQLAALIGAEPGEMTFTASATESLNLAIKGVAEVYRRKGNHIICCRTEHSAVLDTCTALGKKGYDVSVAPVGPDGQPDLQALSDLISDQTILVCVMWANNVTGVVAPISEIAGLVKERGALFLTDATQAVGKIPVSVEDVDLLALSSHKFYGPKGVGALYASRRDPRVRLVPLLHGGGQEKGLRGGTLNTPGIVGLGKAAERAHDLIESEYQRQSQLRDRLEAEIKKRVGHVETIGDTDHRLPGTTNFRIEGTKASDLATEARAIAFSSSSACSSASGKPSHVLTAMGLPDEQSRSAIRLGLGQPTTGEDIDLAINDLSSAITRLRKRRNWRPSS